MTKELIVRDYIGIKNSSTKIGRDGNGNMTFTDAITGTKTLSELVPNQDTNTVPMELNEDILSGKVVQLLSSGRIEQVTGGDTTTKIPYYSTPFNTTGMYRILQIRRDPNDSSKFAVLYSALVTTSNAYLCIGTISQDETILLGTPTQVATPITRDVQRFADFAFDTLSPNRILVTWVDSTYGLVKSVVCTISGKSIYVGSYSILESTANPLSGVSVSSDFLNVGKFIITYARSTTIYAKTVQLDGAGIPSVGGETAIANGTSGVAEFVPGLANRVLYTSASGASYQLYAMALIISGTIISTTTQYVVSTDSTIVTPSIGFDPYNTGKFILGWVQYASPYNKKAIVGVISDTTISFGAAVIISSSVGANNNGDSIGGVQFSSTVANTVFYSTQGASSAVYSGVITLSGNTITVVAGSAIGVSGSTNATLNVPGTNKYIMVLSTNMLVWNIPVSNIPYYGISLDISGSLAIDPFNASRAISVSYSGSYVVVSLLSIINGVVELITTNSTFYSPGVTPSGTVVAMDPIVQGRFVVAFGYSTNATAVIGSITNDVIAAGSGATNIGSAYSYSATEIVFDKYNVNIVYVSIRYSTYAYVKRLVLTGTASMTVSILSSSWNNGFLLPMFTRNIGGSDGGLLVTAPYRDTLTWMHTYRSATLVSEISRSRYDKVAAFDVDANDRYGVYIWANGATPYYTHIDIFESVRDVATWYPSMVLYSVANYTTLQVKFDPVNKDQFTVVRGVSGTPRIIDTYRLNSPTSIDLIGSVTIPGNTSIGITYTTTVPGQLLVSISGTTLTTGRTVYPATNLDNNKIVGVLAESGTLGQTKNVRVLGGVLDGYTGLVPGANYYVHYDGSMTTSSINGVLIGRAISTTSMKLKGPQ